MESVVCKFCGPLSPEGGEWTAFKWGDVWKASLVGEAPYSYDLVQRQGEMLGQTVREQSWERHAREVRDEPREGGKVELRPHHEGPTF